MSVIAVIGTLDSKGEEHAFVAEIIRSRGHEALLIDVGTGADPTVAPDVSRHEVAEAAGIALDEIMARRDRGESVSAMSEAAPVLLAKLHAEGKIDGVISLGGGGGTAISTAAMRALPIGFPKLMVSTLAAGNTAPYLGNTDITMMPSIADVAGINRLSKTIFTRAAGAICGMVEAEIDTATDKPLIVASMFGNTTSCVTEAKRVLEEKGYEVLIFAATGAGGKAMEAIIESGMVAGVLDLTTTEWADELMGGVLSAGPTRMDAAAKEKVPVVVAPGCLDMVNFGEKSSIPARYDGRTFYVHNPQVTLMRTTPQECAELGRILAEKTNAYNSPCAIMIPKKAISVISAEGQPFHDSAADAALFDSIRENATCEVVEMDVEINDPVFARACAEKLLALMEPGLSSPGSKEVCPDMKVPAPFYDPSQPTRKHRRNLPHWQQENAAIFVTWRLADSLPKDKLEAWREERDTWLANFPKPWDEETEEEYHRRFSSVIEELLDRGSGSCVLRRPEISEIVAKALRHFDGERCHIESFVVMPNHVHVLFRPLRPHRLPDILKSWKGFTAREINRVTGASGTLWQAEYWDRLIRSEKHFHRCLRYIRENPVKAGLRDDEFVYFAEPGLSSPGSPSIV